ncbi:HK97 family phage prohead protease [Actinomadura sp. DC4]|uniref:HK97 family phage prohead protease n=1 Tax=Actinomadura sp. DC4 TaxID=3055069 RepID=UPI0025B1779F|nr:HK97 family phage prohead protease [Actinomadura sp. DC4]MDN3356074.1 HK97 family phage prohead protease [Actinomadura sp. DC4]
MQLDRERRGTDASPSNEPTSEDAQSGRARRGRVSVLEERNLPLAGADIRIERAAQDEDTDEGDDVSAERFRGYASKFGEEARYAIGNPLTWGFYEEVAPGTFTKTLSEGDQRMLIDHASYYVVSRVSAGSLNLAQDKIGLAVNSALDPDLSYVSDLKANLRNGNITGMSIGFYCLKADWSTVEIETVDGDTVEADLRTIREARLIEVSAVSFPASPTTEAELSSVAHALAQRGDAAAIEKRVAFRPELRDLLETVREPRESTRGDDVEPREGTRRHVDQVGLAMRGLAARYALPLSR